MKFSPPLPAHISNLPPYIPGRPAGAVARELGLSLDVIVKLASNENPLGMSDSAQEAMVEHAAGASRYPDPDGHELKMALAQMMGLETTWLTLGSGSSEILEMAGRAFLTVGKKGLISQYSFAVYRSAIKSTGAELVVTPAVDFGHDLDAMAAAITPDVGLIFLANPNNPTGTYFDQIALTRFMSAVAGRAVVVLDEAYQEYLSEDERFQTSLLVKTYPNLLVSRTFSKAYGLAGLRVGYAMAQSELTEALNRVRPVFNVNAMAQVAARAALDDHAFLLRSRQINDEGMAQLEGLCHRLAIEYVPSKGNFVLMRVGDAASINCELLERGLIVRPVANYGLPEWLRVSIGMPEEIQRFCEALEDILKNKQV